MIENIEISARTGVQGFGQLCFFGDRKVPRSRSRAVDLIAAQITKVPAGVGRRQDSGTALRPIRQNRFTPERGPALGDN